jgi:hypothetical protein
MRWFRMAIYPDTKRWQLWLTSSSVQPPSTSFALEMLGLLMRNENLEIIEISFAIITPRPSKQFFQIGMTALLLDHCGEERGRELLRR